MLESTKSRVVDPTGQLQTPRFQFRSRTNASRELTYWEAINAMRLAAPLMLVATALFSSYLLRMVTLPWPFSRELTNYVAIVVASFAAVGLTKRVVPFYLLGMLLTLPSVFSSPNFEDSGLRWIGWALLFVAVGPILSGPKVFRFRMFIMLIFVVFLHLSTIGSGVAGLVGFQMRDGRGPFWGLLSHSNILGTVSSLAALDSFSKWSNRQSGRGRTVWFWVLLFELSTSIRAASRAALLGFFIGSLFITFVRDGKTRSKLVVTLALGLSLAVAYYLIRESEHRVGKDDKSLLAHLTEKGFRNTREELWADRIREFQSSPLIGVGFCMGGTEGMRVRQDGYLQEPGSSYLAGLSMTGIVGLIGFIIMIGPLMTATQRMLSHGYGSNPPLHAFTASFWLVTMLTEGFSHYVGSPFCFAVFLWSGVCVDSQNLYPNADPLRVGVK